MSRAFFFGCSYTSYVYPTWADFIGLNFDEYYNFGRGGACNDYIKNILFDAHHVLNFNKDTDTIFVMFSGFTRFSYYNNGWMTGGEIYNDSKFNHITKDFLEKMWSDEWGIYRSWNAMMSIKSLLDAIGVKYNFLVSVDNRPFYETHSLGKEFFEQLLIKESLLEWHKEKYPFENMDSNYIKWGDRDFIDTHPTPKMHLEYIQQFFPMYNTEKTNLFYEQLMKIFSTESMINPCKNFTFKHKFYEIRNRFFI